MVFGVDNTSPYRVSGDSLIQQILSQVLGGGDLANTLAPMATPWIYQLLGLQTSTSRSAFLDMTLMSNMTPYGIYRDQLKTQIGRVANTALTRQTNAARRNWLNDINKTLMSYESWQQQEGNTGRSKDEYEAYIANETAGQMGNPLWSLGYNMLDPDGLIAANSYLREAGANQIRFGVNRGSRRAMLQARAIGNMFMDEGPYDKRNYGYMTIGETSAVVAALTKDIDFFNADGKPQDIKDAVKRLKDTTKAYTEALSPLKDVFGSDIPAMINAIQDLSGQKLTAISPDRLKRMTETIMANAAAGGYDLGTLSSARRGFMDASNTMGVSFMNQLSVNSQAMAALNMTATGLTPAFMTYDRYQRGVNDWVARTSNSRGSELINAAAAVWLDRNPNKTVDDFTKAYQALRDQGVQATEAMLQLSGAGNVYQLGVMGRQSGNYAEMIESDLGGRVARRESLDSLIRAGWNMSSDRAAYDKAIAAIKTQPELLSDPSVLAKSGLDPAVIAQIRDISTGMGMGATGEALVNGLIGYAEEQRKEPIVRKQMALQRTTKGIREYVTSSAGDLARQVLAGKNVSDLLMAGAKIQLADPDTIAMLNAIGEAAKLESDNLSGDARNTYTSEYLTYGLLNGNTNSVFMDALDDFMSSSGNDRVAAARKMTIARYVDEARLSDFVEANGWGGIEDGIMSTYSAALGKYKDERKAATEVEDYITYKNISKLLGESRLDQNVVKSVVSAIGAEWNTEGVYGIDAAKETTKKTLASLGITDAKQQDAYLNFINEAYNKDTSTEIQLTDLFGKIGEMMTKFDQYADKVQKLLDEQGTQPRK